MAARMLGALDNQSADWRREKKITLRREKNNPRLTIAPRVITPTFSICFCGTFKSILINRNKRECVFGF